MIHATLKDTIMKGSREQKIKMVGTKCNRRSSTTWHRTPASAEGELLTMYGTCRRYDSVGTDAKQCIQYSDNDIGDKYGENLMM